MSTSVVRRGASAWRVMGSGDVTETVCGLGKVKSQASCDQIVPETLARGEHATMDVLFGDEADQTTDGVSCGQLGRVCCVRNSMPLHDKLDVLFKGAIELWCRLTRIWRSCSRLQIGLRFMYIIEPRDCRCRGVVRCNVANQCHLNCKKYVLDVPSHSYANGILFPPFTLILSSFTGHLTSICISSAPVLVAAIFPYALSPALVRYATDAPPQDSGNAISPPLCRRHVRRCSADLILQHSYRSPSASLLRDHGLLPSDIASDSCESVVSRPPHMLPEALGFILPLIKSLNFFSTRHVTSTTKIANKSAFSA